MIKKSLLTIIILAIVTASCLKAVAADTPKRIVSLSPNLTDMIYALGELDKVVGVTIYSDFPPSAKTLPKVGGWINPNYEAILALRPDLVVLMKDQDTIFGEKIRKLGLKTLVTNSNDSKRYIEDDNQHGRGIGQRDRSEETGFQYGKET